MKFRVTPGGNFRQDVERAKRQARHDLREAARIATDQASRHARDHIARTMRSSGLGRLGGAVGQTSAVKKRQKDRIYGAIFARGRTNDDSRGAGAIEIYSRGGVIRARGKRWLAYQTNVIPRTTGAGKARRRMTPARYKANGWEQRLGVLQFRPIKPGLALLVAKKVTVSPKTGRAKADTGGRTRTRIKQKEIVVFVLIRVTARQKRFDQRPIVAQHARDVPKLMERALREMAGRRAQRR